MEEINLVLKVDNDDANKQLQKTDDQIDKLKKSSDETGESFKLADTKVGKLWSTFKKGANTAKISMSTLKGAIAATGIGLLLIAVTSLTAYFKKTEEGANKLKVIMAVLGQVMNVITDVFVGIGKTMVEAFENPQQAIIDLWETIKTNLINRVTGIIDYYTNIFDTLKQGFIGVGKSVSAAFSFGDKKDKLKAEADEAFQSMADSALKAGESMVQVLTGVDNFIGKVIDETKDLFNEVIETSTAAGNLQRRLNQLDIDKRNNLVKEANLNIELAAAKTLVDDATLSQEEKLRALNVALEIQNEITNNQIALKREEYEIQKETNILASSKTVDKLKEAELEAELINLTADRINKQKEFETKKSAIIQKGIADGEAEVNATKVNEDKKSAIKKKAIADELSRKEGVLREIEKMEDAAILRAISNDDERNLKRIKIEQQRAEEDLKRRLKNKEISQEEFDILLENLTKTSNDKINAINDANNLERIEAEKITAKEIGQAVLTIATTVANTTFGIQQNKLKNERDSELRNVNLTESQKEKINLKYAKKQKELDIKKAIVNGILSIGKTFATLGYPAGIPMAIISAVNTVAQIATIKSTKYQTGGIVQGNSHSNGGVNINAEGGEGMVNVRSMQNPLIAQEVLRLNNLGNAGAADSYQGNSVVNEEAIARAVVSAIGSIPITVTENQITDKQKDVEVRESRFTQN